MESSSTRLCPPARTLQSSPRRSLPLRSVQQWMSRYLAPPNRRDRTAQGGDVAVWVRSGLAYGHMDQITRGDLEVIMANSATSYRVSCYSVCCLSARPAGSCADNDISPHSPCCLPTAVVHIEVQELGALRCCIHVCSRIFYYIFFTKYTTYSSEGEKTTCTEYPDTLLSSPLAF